MRLLSTCEMRGTRIRSKVNDQFSTIIGSYPGGFVVEHDTDGVLKLPFKNVKMFLVDEDTCHDMTSEEKLWVRQNNPCDITRFMKDGTAEIKRENSEEWFLLYTKEQLKEIVSEFR